MILIFGSKKGYNLGNFFDATFVVFQDQVRLLDGSELKRHDFTFFHNISLFYIVQHEFPVSNVRSSILTLAHASVFMG